MMTLQDKYDELDEIIITLDMLIDNTHLKEYVEDLREIKYNAERELEEIEPKLQEEWEDEKRYMNSEYERSVI